jgi:polyhydroxybutyrate depolymerase
VKKILLFLLRAGIVIVVLLGALFAWFGYSPAPEVPRLSGKLTRGAIESGGHRRTYLTYVPKGLKRGAPLVVVMHGSGEDGAQVRVETGYGFERLADEHGFAVVYPDAYGGHWNACNVVGDYSANRLGIDDVSFLTGLADSLITEFGLDPGRVFATGVSRGGHMAFRLALEAPSRFRAVAAVAANMPTPDNSKCKPAGPGTSSVMIMNGTKDPLNPFDGGEVRFFGLYGRGTVRSWRASGQYFADLNDLTAAPESTEARVADGVGVEHVLWHNGSRVEVELVAIRGGGHALPQPWRRGPRGLGPTPKEPNGPAVIWGFFQRQRPD